MTARSTPTGKQRADEMRARILSDREAWRVLRGPVLFEYDPAHFTIENDNWDWALATRDPRAIELQYRWLRLEFWNSDRSAGEVRLFARKAVMLARHLEMRAIERAA